MASSQSDSDYMTELPEVTVPQRKVNPCRCKGIPIHYECIAKCPNWPYRKKMNHYHIFCPVCHFEIIRTKHRVVKTIYPKAKL